MSRRAPIVRTLVAFACACASFAHAQSNDTPKPFLTKKTIRVAADLSAMPWYSIDPKTGTYTGFEYEFALKIFEGIDPSLKVEIVPMEWERFGDALQKNKADVALNAYFLPAQKERQNGKFEWSNCYFRTSLGMLYLKKNGAPKSIEDIKNKRITIFPDNAAIAALKRAGVKKYSKSNSDFKFADFVKSGKADFAIIDKVGAQYMFKKNADAIGIDTALLEKYSEGCYAAFAIPANKSLLEAINSKGIPALQKHSKEILEKYGLSE